MTFDFDRGSAAPVLTATCANSSWYLAYTRPRLEAVARQNLQQQGFEAYLPLYKRLKKTGAGTEVIFEPMFARYVFFRPSRDFQSISPAHSTRGVAHLVRFGTEMATVRPDTLNAIRQFEQERNAADVAELSSLHPGYAVRFRDPALNGLEGLVKSVSSRRVTVLLEFMGQQQLVSVNHHQLEAA